MAVPKKRTGKAKQASRRANWKATVPATTVCKNCGEIVLTHTVCTKCGFYKQAAVSIKNEKYVNPQDRIKEAKKPAAKKATKDKKLAKEFEKEIEIAEISEKAKAKTSGEEIIETTQKSKTVEKTHGEVVRGKTEE